LIYPSRAPYNASLWVDILAVNAHHSWQAQKTGKGLTIYLILEEKIQRKNISFVELFKNVAPMFFGRNFLSETISEYLFSVMKQSREN
jgi:hypothetical protein